jgi:lactoylglutathione lyase
VRTLHVGVRVEDLVRSLDFYTSLGYEVVGSVPETEFGSLTMLKLPGDEFVSLELVHDPTAGPIDPGGLNHVVIQVEDLPATITRLTARGLQTDPPQLAERLGRLPDHLAHRSRWLPHRNGPVAHRSCHRTYTRRLPRTSADVRRRSARVAHVGHPG